VSDDLTVVADEEGGRGKESDKEEIGLFSLGGTHKFLFMVVSDDLTVVADEGFIGTVTLERDEELDEGFIGTVTLERDEEEGELDEYADEGDEELDDEEFIGTVTLERDEEEGELDE
jgi:hypothetical protein